MTAIVVPWKVEVPPKLIADAMCSAFEGGSYGSLYWLPKVEPPKGLRMTKAEIAEHCNWYSMPRTWTPGAGLVVIFHELVDEWKDERVKHELHVDRLPELLVRVAEKDPELFAALLKSEDDPLDGPASDSLVQLLVLGEVRYG